MQFLVETGGGTAEILLDALAHERLSVVEYEPYEVEAPPVLILAILGDREYLLIPFQGEFQAAQILLDFGKQSVEFLFRGCEEYHIVGISEIVPHPLLLLDPMVEVGEHQVCEVLAQIVADRHAVGAVDDRIEQGEPYPCI